MKDRGFECIGCTMKLYHNEDAGIERSRTCCSLDDVEDARSAAYKLGMPLYVFNFTDAFRDTVIRKFIESYENGITPNPCIAQWPKKSVLLMRINLTVRIYALFHNGFFRMSVGIEDIEEYYRGFKASAGKGEFTVIY